MFQWIRFDIALLSHDVRPLFIELKFILGENHFFPFILINKRKKAHVQLYCSSFDNRFLIYWITTEMHTIECLMFSFPLFLD